MMKTDAASPDALMMKTDAASPDAHAKDDPRNPPSVTVRAKVADVQDLVVRLP
jgi:hypothetical protein